MRLRRKPWARPELDACDFYIKDPPSLIGKWHGSFKNEQPVFVEFGCGKGFIAKTAASELDVNFIAVDIKSEVLALAKRNIEQEYKNKNLSVDNIKLFSFDIARIDMVFCGADVVDRIYINFPNPWPKDSHKKRRLTHTRQLFKYRTFLKQGGEILFKTDDDELYHDTVEYLRLSGFKIEENIESLYENGIPKDTVITEHEKMFFDEGLKIHFIRATNV